MAGQHQILEAFKQGPQTLYGTVYALKEAKMCFGGHTEIFWLEYSQRQAHHIWLIYCKAPITSISVFPDS